MPGSAPGRRGARRARAGALAAALLLVLPASARPPAEPGFVVVVNAGNPATRLGREQVARLFLRKVKRWPSGDAVEPVDLAPGAPARDAFTRTVLGKSVSTVRAYWQQRIFSGAEVPPPEKPAEQDALEYVRTHPAAIGYVSARAPLPGGVRPVEVAP